jgi:hypothetical protein
LGSIAPRGWPPWSPRSPFCSFSGGCLAFGKASPTITRPGLDPRTPTPLPRSRPAPPRSPIGNSTLVSPYVERFSLWYWSAFGAWKVRDDECLLVCFWSACSFGFGMLAFRLVFVRLRFGYRLVPVGLVLVLLVLDCLLPFGCLLSARRDRCWIVWMTCSKLGLLGLLAWFACLVRLDSFGGKEGPRLYI